jgi:plastocyanin
MKILILTFLAVLMTGFVVAESIPTTDFDTDTILVYKAVLTPGQEGINNSAAMGEGFFVINPDQKSMDYYIWYYGLSSDETAAHIHGPAGFGQNASPIVGLQNGSMKVGTWNFNDSEEWMLLSGMDYVNIHTANFPGGEIRGQILPIIFYQLMPNQFYPGINLTCGMCTSFNNTGTTNQTNQTAGNQTNQTGGATNITNETNVTAVEKNVAIADFSFTPQNITIGVGDTVIWTNNGPSQHTVTSDSGLELESPVLDVGQNYSHMFGSEGNFSYHCSIYPTLMNGTVFVQMKNVTNQTNSNQTNQTTNQSQDSYTTNLSNTTGMNISNGSNMSNMSYIDETNYSNQSEPCMSEDNSDKHTDAEEYCEEDYQETRYFDEEES